MDRNRGECGVEWSKEEKEKSSQKEIVLVCWLFCVCVSLWAAAVVGLLLRPSTRRDGSRNSVNSIDVPFMSKNRQISQ